ncbi:MAG: SET domain-containing protein-lysine N-methyltransferase [Anaerolineae bacterium]|nr:SET domain-containing protein-lysine N-methyltransferase [Anaerolineae bacterium]
MNALPVNMLKEIHHESWIDPRIEMRSSTIHGRGIFATADIQQGETVIIWGGEFFTSDEILAGKAVDHSYTIFDKDLYLGHSHEQGNSIDDFMNHSCDPNIWMLDAVTWAARRDISAGEEITADCAMYWGPEEDVLIRWQCRCGSNNCRKHFTSLDWQLPELHERYGRHFSDYVNAHIDRLQPK